MDEREVGKLAPVSLRPKDAARYLGVGETTLRALPIIPVRLYPTGTRKAIALYLRRDLDAFIEEQATRRDPQIQTKSQRAS